MYRLYNKGRCLYNAAADLDKLGNNVTNAVWNEAWNKAINQFTAVINYYEAQYADHKRGPAGYIQTYLQAYIDRGVAYLHKRPPQGERREYEEAISDFWFVINDFGIGKDSDFSSKKEEARAIYNEVKEVFWEGSNDFEYDIRQGVVEGVVSGTRTHGPVSLRAEPSFDAAEIESLKEGDRFTVWEQGDRVPHDGQSAFWYYVKTQSGSTGWYYGIFMDLYLTENWRDKLK